MTAAEAYDLTTRGGATDFAEVIAICERLGPYCLIGGLAVNCYVEPLYTLDADVVVIAGNLAALGECLNAQPRGGDLRIQFTLDGRYQDFLARAEVREVFATPVRVACLRDVVQGKLWAYSDSARRLSKRKKDELDLIRLGEAYPELVASYPRELAEQFGGR